MLRNFSRSLDFCLLEIFSDFKCGTAQPRTASEVIICLASCKQSWVTKTIDLSLTIELKMRLAFLKIIFLDTRSNAVVSLTLFLFKSLQFQISYVSLATWYCQILRQRFQNSGLSVKITFTELEPVN